jgi:Tfp pilus assembly protein PilN
LRAVNLIPADQRRGGRRVGVGSPGPGGLAVYGLLGVLAVAVVAVAALVLTSNRVNDRKSTVAALERDQATAKTAADALRPYGNFAQLQRQRVETINSLAQSAFNWERVLRQLARTIPSDVWLTNMKATVRPDVSVEGGGAAGASDLRSKTQAPAVELSGCTYSHKAVARMMTRMRNLDNVTEVTLGGSERPSGKTQQQTAGSGSESGGGESTDCRTRYNITKFDLLVVLGDAPSTTPAVPTPGPASPVSSAQAAVATSEQASANAGGGE